MRPSTYLHTTRQINRHELLTSYVTLQSLPFNLFRTFLFCGICLLADLGMGVRRRNDNDSTDLIPQALSTCLLSSVSLTSSGNLNLKCDQVTFSITPSICVRLHQTFVFSFRAACPCFPCTTWAQKNEVHPLSTRVWRPLPPIHVSEFSIIIALSLLDSTIAASTAQNITGEAWKLRNIGIEALSIPSASGAGIMANAMP